MSLEKIIFKEKRFSDLLEEIYDNQKRKEKQISGLIGELRPLIQDTGDATIIVPLIKEYMEIGVRNDDQLVKIATILQRIFQNQDSGADPQRNACAGSFSLLSAHLRLHPFRQQPLPSRTDATGRTASFRHVAAEQQRVAVAAAASRSE